MTIYFPTNAINFCLQSENIKIDKIDFVSFYDKPLLKFDRILETYLSFPAKGLKSFIMSVAFMAKTETQIPDLRR